jgi:hypothetical protein
MGMVVATAFAAVGFSEEGKGQSIDLSTSGWASSYWSCDIRQNCGASRVMAAYTRPDWRVTAYLATFGGYANPDLTPDLLYQRLWGYRPDYLDGVTGNGPDIPTPVTPYTPDIPPAGPGPDIPPPPPPVTPPGGPGMVTPEPATMIMLATGLGGVGLSALRRRRKSASASADLN